MVKQLRTPKILKWLRLLVYLSCVFMLMSALAARSLYAHASEAALGLGRQLSGLGDLTRGSHSILLNGARVHYSRVTIERDLDVVLDQLESYCKGHPGPLGAALAEVDTQHPDVLEKYFPDTGLRYGFMQHRSDDAGLVLCFSGSGKDSLKSFVEATHRFAETSDLSEFGHVRYAFAERLGNGFTRIVTFFSNEKIELERMFPATGDAAGSDSQVLPRPPASRRTLSAAVESMPYAIRSYASNKRMSELRRFYGDYLKKRSWKFAAEAEGTASYFSPEGQQVFVSMMEEDQQTFVTLTEVGRGRVSGIVGVEAK